LRVIGGRWKGIKAHGLCGEDLACPVDKPRVPGVLRQVIAYGATTNAVLLMPTVNRKSGKPHSKARRVFVTQELTLAVL
jgi:hypothetical protein